MAQAKLNDFFTSKKRTDSPQAAKRRKIEISCPDKKYSRSKLKCDDAESPGLFVSDSKSQLEDVVPVTYTTQEEESSSSVLPNVTCTISKRTKDSVSRVAVRRSGRSQNDKRSKESIFAGNKNKSKKTNTLKSEPGQVKLTDLLKKSAPNLSSANDDDSASKSSVCTTTSSGDSGEDLQLDITIEERTVVAEEVTSVWDNHGQREGNTPRKRIITIEETALEGSHLPRRKMSIRKQSPAESQDVARSEAAKKKLVLSLSPNTAAGPSKHEDDEADDTDNEVVAVLTGKSRLLALVSEIIVPLDSAVSPLPATPERPQEVSSSPEPVTPKLQNLSEKLKVLSKMNGQALRNRLKQSGKLGDLHERLGQLDRAIKEKKSQAETAETPARAETDKSETVLPAHQRFETLVEEGPPSLSLPYTYRLLESTFQAMDTVVSMMHNRSEMCTFSKLKAAVQNMTKKNFEETTVGQIKTIVPDAYIFRQENNIPTFGHKTSGYQLTVEASLGEDAGTNEAAKTSTGKPTFTASALLKRKLRFKNNLLTYLKHIHKEFLASLKYPLSVPDDKLTRWHPHFQLDKVAQVVAAPLPQPPDVKVYHSAKDVLEKQRGKLNPRVEAALSKIVSEKEDRTSDNNSQGRSVSSSSTPASSSTSSEQNSPSLRGIPPALLAKIRAKEAQKMEEALTRSPAEDNKTRIMSHLPEIMRILRTYFITEKKPAVPLEAAYKKLEESYHTGISHRELEQHVEMLKELAPELITVVEIKRGKFLKLDKNVDIQAISSRILNLVTSRK
ncbi:unnamed protein product [Candidula unifasciata]|uniref:CDT1 Geminin-binding domain-containing protein n=1 Tax=Candidula unifasciata TaxID=100452 RepID=A0A8S3ZAG0_9EUPU|nr:unnamed protein product [Candidula unifasciata]